MSCAFSRLMSITASLGDSPPPATARCSIGTTSMPPETSAARTQYQLSRRNFTWRAE
jgi:hypothetical protein